MTPAWPAPMNNLPVDIYKLHANAVVSVESPSFFFLLFSFFSHSGALWPSVLGFCILSALLGVKPGEN